MPVLSSSIPMSMGVPQDQNTAPVLEFRCLWTADTKRKQKRWQDGRLKYHTFNRRVMVYDERSNFVGDTHWREKTELNEGDELELERGGILVEVAEYLEKRQQDLTDLIDKRVKEREERFAAKHGDSSPARPDTAIRSQSIAAAHLRPKPLNAILGTPTGHYGKALVSNTSPFEQRQMLKVGMADENESPRPAKRRKANEPAPSKSGFAQNLMGATLSFSQRPSSTGTIRHEPLKLKSIQRSDDNNDGQRPGTETEGSFTRRQESILDTRRETHGKSRSEARKRESARSGFASSLTGASLLLSTTGVKNTATTSVSRRNPPQTIDLSMDTSSDDDDHASMPSIKPKPVIASKSRKITQKLKEPRIGPPTFRSSSPSAEVATESRSLLRQTANTHSIQQQEAEKPHSSLRIRSRPRSKKMMFMEQPGTRSPPSSRRAESFTSVASKDSSNANASFSGELRRGPTTRRDTHGSPELPEHCDGPLPEFSDFELNYQTNEADLSSNRPTTVHSFASHNAKMKIMLHRRRSTSPDPQAGISGKVSKQQIAEKSSPEQLLEAPDSRVIEKDDKDAGDAISFSSRVLCSETEIPRDLAGNAGVEVGEPPAIRGKQSHIAHPSPPMAKVRGHGEIITVDTTEISGMTAQPTAATTRQPEQPSADISITNIEGLIDEAPHELGPKDKGMCRQQVNGGRGDGATKSNHRTTRIGSATVLSEATGGLDRSKTARNDRPLLLGTSNGTNFLATGRFMAKLMPAAVQNDRVPDAKNPSSINHHGRATSPPVKLSPDTVESIASVSLIPESDQTGRGFVSVNQMSKVPNQGGLAQAAGVTGQGPSRPRLINPATRGMSISNTAKKTLPALATGANIMAPPPLGIISRGAVNNSNVVGNQNPEEKGPWSRESFDLFGSWRPPTQLEEGGSAALLTA
ncbi:meiotic chromosome segregation protein [Rutstroemia sp. NJR-2017a BVV2]|nr:meiotic chromosome segregation protein [Rutstroemia sp. NJR-2017a BVV2]PQE25197.1 meiotic chromosome segregation protein [Rutstroemia sp. NJR-2017a BVV2]